MIEVNDALEGEPERINQDPYGTFIVVIKPDEVDESALLDAAAYDAFVAESH